MKLTTKGRFAVTAMMDLALRGQEAGFLPAYQHVILDEAHGVEDVASEHFGASLTEG